MNISFLSGAASVLIIETIALIIATAVINARKNRER